MTYPPLPGQQPSDPTPEFEPRRRSRRRDQDARHTPQHGSAPGPALPLPPQPAPPPPVPQQQPQVPQQPMEPAGWYHATTDPPEVARWWDGSRWTMHTRQWPPS